MNGKEILLFLVIFASWFALNRWVLPWMGIPTCMSGSCSAGCALPRSGMEQDSAAEDTKAIGEEAAPKQVEETIPAGPQSSLPGR